MSHLKLQFTILSALLIASAAVPVLIHHQALAQWRQREELSSQRSGQIEQLLAENKRLVNLVAHWSNSPLSDEEFHELLRLRGKIGRLRSEAGEMARLKERHQRLLAAAKRLEFPNPTNVLAGWPKTQLSPVGYADPISALQTGLWAMSQNNSTALESSLTPNAKSGIAQMAHLTALWVSSRDDPDVLAGKVAPENAKKYSAFAANLSSADQLAVQTKAASDSLGPSSGLYIIGQKSSPEEMTLEVYFAGEGTTRQVVLKKIGQDWKLDGIYLAGANGSQSRVGVWP